MLNIRSRIAAAAGVSAAGVVAAIIAQWVPGTVVEVVLAGAVIAAAGPAMALGLDESVAARSRDALVRQTRFAPVMALAAAAASYRAGGILISGVSGAHAVGGLALARGPVPTVAGMWLCLLAALIAIAGSIPEPIGQDGGIADRFRVVAPVVQVVVVVALFAGPQWRSAVDVIPWLLTGVAAGAAIWFGRRFSRFGFAPWIATGLSAAGFGLAILGGRP